MQFAVDGLYRARSSEKIHDEWIRNLLMVRDDLSGERLQQTRETMNRAIPDSGVHDYEDLVSTLDLPDPDDRHVLAAAIKCSASVRPSVKGV